MSSTRQAEPVQNLESRAGAPSSSAEGEEEGSCGASKPGPSEERGGVLLQGQGVPYRMAADQEHAKAQFNLACVYATGQGLPRSHNQAAKWFRKAAVQGEARAQFNLDPRVYGYKLSKSIVPGT